MIKDPNNPCLFCNINNDDIIFENNYAKVSFDTYPVSKFHSLIFPKRHISNFFELSDEEVLACNKLIKKIQEKVQKEDKTIKGFNIGSNSGKVAGQSIMHCHIHLIPRREGDVNNPQGGVRGVIPSKQHYIRKKILKIL